MGIIMCYVDLDCLKKIYFLFMSRDATKHYLSNFFFAITSRHILQNAFLVWPTIMHEEPWQWKGLDLYTRKTCNFKLIKWSYHFLLVPHKWYTFYKVLVIRSNGEYGPKSCEMEFVRIKGFVCVNGLNFVESYKMG